MNLFIPQNKLSRIPGYLTIQFVRFEFKGKEAVNAKILKVSELIPYSCITVLIFADFSKEHICLIIKRASLQSFDNEAGFTELITLLFYENITIFE